MTKTLILMRHGLAEDKSLPIPDEKRALVPEGREKTRQSAEVVLRTYRPQLILTSPLVRALQTAEIVLQVAREFGQNPAFTSHKVLAPSSSFDQWKKFIKHESLFSNETKAGKGPQVVLAVGHEPLLSKFVSEFLKVEHPLGPFKKSGVVVIETENLIAGQLLAYLPPHLLRNLE